MKVTWGHTILSLLTILFTNSIFIFGQNVGGNLNQNIDCANTNSKSSSTGNRLMNTLLTIASVNGVLSNVLPVLQQAQQNQPTFSLKPIIIAQVPPTLYSVGSSQLNLLNNNLSLPPQVSSQISMPNLSNQNTAFSLLPLESCTQASQSSQPNLSNQNADLSLLPQGSCTQSSQPNLSCKNGFISNQNTDLPAIITEFVSYVPPNCACQSLYSSSDPCRTTPSIYEPTTCIPYIMSPQSTLSQCQTTPCPSQPAQYECQAGASASPVLSVVIEGNGESNSVSNLKTILPLLFLALSRNSYGGCRRCGGCGDCGSGYGYRDYGRRGYSGCGYGGSSTCSCSSSGCRGCSTICSCCPPIPVPYPYILEIPLPPAEEDSPEWADNEDEENPSENKPQDCTKDEEDEQETEEKPKDENREIET